MPVALAAGCLLLLPAPTQAQTYTWTSNSDGTWSTASNWLNNVPPVSGAGTRLVFAPTDLPTANDEDVATNDISNPFSLTFLDLKPSFGAVASAGRLALAGSPLRFVQQGANLPTITVGGAAARIGANLQFDSATTISGAGHGHLTIDGVLSGAAGLTIDRSSAGGQTILSADNSGYAGGVTLRNGTLMLTTDTALGTGDLTVFGGTLRSGVSTLTLSNNISAQSDFRYVSGAATTSSTATVLNGVISGSGGVVNQSISAASPPSGVSVSTAKAVLDLRGANTYTGLTSAAGTLGTERGGNAIRFGGGGSALNTSGVSIGFFGTVELDNSGQSSTNRLPDGAVITTNGGGFLFTGSATAATSETVGRLVGSGSVTVTSGTGQSAVLTFGGTNPLQRQAGGVFFFQGTNLGQNAPGTANTANILFTNSGTISSALVGNTANVSSTTATDVAILPFATGVIFSSSTPLTTTPTFVTYDPTKGVRALPNTQFAALSDGTVTQNNVRVTNTVNVTSPTTVNSLRLDTDGRITGAGTVTVTSGAVLTSGTTSLLGTELGNLRFIGEGVITNYDNRNINSVTGTADGLVLNGGGLRTVNTPLAVPGPLTINAGMLYVTSFGAGSELGTVTDIRLNGGTVAYTGSGPAATTRGFALGAGGGGLGGGDSLTVSGQLTDLPGQAGVLIAGNLILTGANTYTGGTVSLGALQVSADTNLGAAGTPITLAPGSLSFAGLAVDGSFATTRPLVIGANSALSTAGIPPRVYLEVTSGNRFTLNGPVGSPAAFRTQALGLAKTGPGTLVVGGADNAMNGQFAVSAGTLLVNGSLGPVNFVETATTNGLVVSSGAAVGGTGVIGRGVRVASGATLTPGDPLTGSGAGTLTTERLTLSDGATWLVDVRSAIARPGGSPSDVNTNDRLAARGPVTFGTSAFTLTLDGTGQTFTAGSVYDYYIASATGYDNFNPVNITLAQTNFSTAGSFALGVSGGDLIVTFIPVPEPATVLGVAAAGLWAVGLARRRCRRPE